MEEKNQVSVKQEIHSTDKRKSINWASFKILFLTIVLVVMTIFSRIIKGIGLMIWTSLILSVVVPILTVIIYLFKNINSFSELVMIIILVVIGIGIAGGIFYRMFTFIVLLYTIFLNIANSLYEGSKKLDDLINDFSVKKIVENLDDMTGIIDIKNEGGYYSGKEKREYYGT